MLQPPCTATSALWRLIPCFEARCQDLDHALRSCTEKSALLREDAQKAGSNAGSIVGHCVD